MKKIEELYARIAEKKLQAQALLDNNKVEEAKALISDIRADQEAIAAQEALDSTIVKEMQAAAAPNVQAKQTAALNTVKAFADAARNGFYAAMTEGSKPDGGYTVPEDIQTQINTLLEAKDSLDTLVSKEFVSAESGERTYKTRAQQNGFAKVAEGAAIGGKNTPQFSRIKYAVEKYAGYFTVTNELLDDTDANITGTLVNWIADESRVTHNKLILETLETIGTVESWTDIDDLKKVLNVTLDRAFLAGTKIITNQDGLQYLDTLKDADGRYLLQPMVQDPTRYLLFGRELVVVGNSTMPSDTTTTAGSTIIPFVVGDLTAAIKLFVRKGLNVNSSNVAMDAFEKDLTIWRAIERLDCIAMDDKAIVRGSITVQG